MKFFKSIIFSLSLLWLLGCLILSILFVANIVQGQSLKSDEAPDSMVILLVAFLLAMAALIGAVIARKSRPWVVDERYRSFRLKC